MSFFGFTRIDFPFTGQNTTFNTSLNPGAGLYDNTNAPAIGEYVETRNINGQLWFALNAFWDQDAQTWTQVNTAEASYAMSFIAGVMEFWTAAAVGGVISNPPITFIPGGAIVFPNNVTINGTLTVNGNEQINGNLTVTGTITGILPAAYQITRFIANGTFTTPANSSTATIYRYRIVGGGGGGGGANGSFAAGGGGGGGGYAEGSFTGIATSSGITITVGTGGTAGANTGGNGGTGNSSVIGAPVSITAFGGNGGTGSTAAGAPGNSAPGGNGGATSGSPTISITGGLGQLGLVQSGTVQFGGAGGSTPLGVGGSNGPNNGFPGQLFGGGGGGASNVGTGGVGGAGIVIIERMTF